MFADAGSFNQDLSGWCVSKITSKPEFFSDGTALTKNHLPKWGTCPGQ